MLGSLRIIGCLAVILVAILVLFSLAPPAIAGQEGEKRILKELHLNDSETTFYYAWVLGFTPDGSFYLFGQYDSLYSGSLCRLSLISPDLKVIWNRTFTSQLGYAVASDGSIRFLGGNISDYSLTLFNIDITGADRWSKRISNIDAVTSMVVADDGSILMSCMTNWSTSETSIVGFDASGNKKDLVQPSELNYSISLARLENGTLIAQDYSWAYGISPDLEIRWRIQFPQFSMSTGRVFSEESITYVDNQFGWENGTTINIGGLYRYDRAGNILWKYQDQNKSEWYYNLMERGSDKTLITFANIMDYTNYTNQYSLLAIRSNGTLAWRYDLKSSIFSMPAFNDESVIIWNGTDMVFFNADGHIVGAVNITLGNSEGVPSVFIEPNGSAYLVFKDYVAYVGTYIEPQKPLDLSIFLMVPLIIAVLILAAYIMGRRMKGDDE